MSSSSSSQLFLPFIVDYAKSNRSKCQLLKTNIVKGTLRFGIMIKSRNFDGMQPNWYNAKVFFTKRHRRKKPKSITEINGYNLLRPKDQIQIEEWIKKMNTNTKTSSKTSNKKQDNNNNNKKNNEQNEENRKEQRQLEQQQEQQQQQLKKDEIRKQSAKIWKIIDLTTDLLIPISIVKAILQYNGMIDDNNTNDRNPKTSTTTTNNRKRSSTTNTKEGWIRKLAEILYFGIPPKCCGSSTTTKATTISGNGGENDSNAYQSCFCDSKLPLSFCDKECQYVCNVQLEWGPCIYRQDVNDTICIPAKVPNVDTLLRIETTTIRTTTTTTLSSPFKNTTTSSSTNEDDDENKKSIITKWIKVMEHICTDNDDTDDTGMTTTPGSSDRNQNGVIAFQPKQRLYLERSNKKRKINDDGEDVNDNDNDNDNMKRTSKKTKSTFPSSKKKNNDTSKPKKIYKMHLSRACIDPECDLATQNYHVLDEAYYDNKSNHNNNTTPDPSESFPLQLYDTILCRTNLSSGANSQYKLQILVPDSVRSSSSKNTRTHAYLWRVWGRVGEETTKCGGSKLDKFKTIQQAKDEFYKLFNKQTGNDWFNRKQFIKQPGSTYDQLDICYNNNNNGEENKNNNMVQVKANDPSSNLNRRVQTVIASIFDTGIAIEQLRELKIDITKMPLGNLSEKQILDAFSVLKDIETILVDKDNDDDDVEEDNVVNTVAKPLQQQQQQRLIQQLRASKLQQLSNQFYTKCPSIDPILIDTKEILKSKITLVDELLNLQRSASVMKNDHNNDSNNTFHKTPVDVAYEKLKTKLIPIDPMSEEWAVLDRYVKNTRNASFVEQQQDDDDDDSDDSDDSSYNGGGFGSYYSMNDWERKGLRLIDAFTVIRENELERFHPSKVQLGNRKLLWHGSHISNYSGILRHGLRIAPPEAPCSGYRFGKGIYFADLLGKSANYCRMGTTTTSNSNSLSSSSSSSEILVMACDVALGTTYETLHDIYMEEPMSGTNSTHALSELIPDPSNKFLLHDNIDDYDDYSTTTNTVTKSPATERQRPLDTNGNNPNKNNMTVVVPFGKAMKNQNVDMTYTKPSCDVSEYIVYDQSQVNIRYLLRLSIDPNTPSMKDENITNNDVITDIDRSSDSDADRESDRSSDGDKNDDDDDDDCDHDDPSKTINQAVAKMPRIRIRMSQPKTTTQTIGSTVKTSTTTTTSFIPNHLENFKAKSASGLTVLTSRTFVEGLRLTVVRGDITTSMTNVIVIPSNRYLSLDGEVGERVKSVAGQGLVDEINNFLSTPCSSSTRTTTNTTSSLSKSSSSFIPSNFVRLETRSNDGNQTIKNIAINANVQYITAYYRVEKKKKKEIVTPKKNIIVTIPSKGQFLHGKDARDFLNIGHSSNVTLNDQTTISCPDIEIFVQSTSHSRKILANSAVLLEQHGATLSSNTQIQQRQQQLSNYKGCNNLTEFGGVCMLDGHKLNASSVLFVVSPIFHEQQSIEMAKSKLMEAVTNVLVECSKANIKTVTLPSIGSGRAGYDKGHAATWIVTAIANYLEASSSTATVHQSIQEVCFCVYDDESVDAYKQGILAYENK